MSFIEQIVLNRLWNAYDYGYVYTKRMYWKWNIFLLRFWKVSCTDSNIVKIIHVHTEPQKQQKMLYYSCQVSSWQCQFIKKLVQTYSLNT